MSWEKMKAAKPSTRQMEIIRSLSKLLGIEVVLVKTMDEASKLIIKYERMWDYVYGKTI